VRRRAFWPPIPIPPMRSHVGTTRCNGPLFFWHRTTRARVLHSDRSRTPRLCLMTLKVTMTITPAVAYSEANLHMLTHDTRKARVGDVMWGRCPRRKGKLPCQSTTLSKNENKQGAQRAHPVFRSFLLVDSRNCKACLWCRVRGGKAEGGSTGGLELGKVGVAVAITGLPSARLEDRAHARGDVRTE